MSKPLNLVLCWHMHQPWYRESLKGNFKLPWVYLHALKDYSDMAHHLEAHPKVKAVVNFVPVLLEQLDSYSQQAKDWLSHGAAFQDPLLNYLCGATPIPSDVAGRKAIIEACKKANPERMIHIYPAFSNLCKYVHPVSENEIDDNILPYLQDNYFHDILTWYHIAWLGHSVKQDDSIKSLIDKQQNFTQEDRKQLIGVMAEVFHSIIPRYKALAESGQVELSMTPYSHPIVPLLIDFNSMDCALPGAPKPAYEQYPGGRERVRWHMQHGLKVFLDYFGIRPKGVWLSEGSVSDEALGVLAEFDMQWAASGEGVWNNSSHLSKINTAHPEFRQNLFSVQQVNNQPTYMFFRDDGMSDLIGFEYQNWVAEDAAEDFIKNINNIRNFLGGNVDQHVLSVILDGENAWEYYPDNAFHFLGALYERLAESDAVNLTTFSDARKVCPPAALPNLCAGSWVYGSFSTWIGDPDKNRGWDRLVEAKLVYDKVIEDGSLTPQEMQQATLQLAVCEGSDWFWWFGDYNPAESVRDFEQLFRHQLKLLYQMLKQPVPDNLDEPLSYGGGQAANAGTMRRGHEN